MQPDESNNRVYANFIKNIPKNTIKNISKNTIKNISKNIPKNLGGLRGGLGVRL
ncbi:hypothetical protein [Helicobacter pylori]|uniref:hypothetical protein n=1 Tax=Helicobacter pylori TaxID=210 RepID=UPI0020A266F0|nr:hypothetical protein [Helicobacter pylori]